MWTLVLLGAVGGTTVLALSAWAGKWSLYLTDVGEFEEQTVPFSHEHHVGGLGIDCRYCHTSVETSSNAGFPATHTCMTCHSQLWTNAAMLEPVRKSYATSEPLHWKRVYSLPDYVYFDHSIHVAKGVGCSTCHGRVDQMPLMTKVMPFFMEDCLECHRHPEKYVRPADQIFNLAWTPAADPGEAEREGLALVQSYHIAPERRLTDCYVCHR